ncbi:uncharacterized protein [Rhodnius prolixus]|uniref:Uncharacterized protein n=1 Tax=Rhodnius prolixus TaxID=13249 RepID=A0A4V0Y8U4_RHOPR
MDYTNLHMRVEVHKCADFVMQLFPEARLFIEKDVPAYGDVILHEILQISEPRICLVDAEKMMVLREVNIGNCSRKECNNVMWSFGKVPLSTYRLNTMPCDVDRVLNSYPPS